MRGIMPGLEGDVIRGAGMIPLTSPPGPASDAPSLIPGSAGAVVRAGHGVWLRAGPGRGGELAAAAGLAW